MLSRALRPSRFCGLRSFGAAIDRSAVEVRKNPAPGKLPQLDSLVFGGTFTDHMLEIDWDHEKGWSNPVIKPVEKFQLDPWNSALHYAIQCFEGAKAFKDDAGTVRTFRLDMNMKRLSASMKRSGMPGLTDKDQEEVKELIHELIRLDQHWVPQEDGYSLYLRPAAFGTTPTLGLYPPTNVKLFTIMSPVGPYYKTGFKPVSLHASDKYSRAFYGGTGAHKLGANYGTGVAPFKECIEDGYGQILWLLKEGDDYIMTEAGTMNLFVYWVNKNGEKELITAELGELVLPGITRDSILAIARGRGMKVTERVIHFSEFLAAHKEGRLLEVFGSGTAAIVSQVNKIGFQGTDLAIPVDPNDPNAGLGPLAKSLFDEIVAIQRGRISHPWCPAL
jgi:branched-chain amino acid aminotransferase